MLNTILNDGKLKMYMIIVLLVIVLIKALE